MPDVRNIYLVGPMGAGKTTIGRLLAAELYLPFADTDREIEHRCGADIPWIFDVEGEQGFRDREEAILIELTADPGLVLATGGGIVMRETNRALLKASGFVVYLTTGVDQQYQRTVRDRKRPLLQTEDPRAVLQQLFELRDPLYREVADLVVATGGHNPHAVVQDIAAVLSSRFEAG